MSTVDLFSAHEGAQLSLPNRIVMAPMTRLRAQEDGTPTEIMATFYAQRASAGLIVTEGIWPHSTGQSEWRVPGLQTVAHAAAWRPVTDGVHRAGGLIFAQLMHGGRKGHPRARWDGTLPAGPSPVAEPEHVHLPDGGKIASATPRGLTHHDLDLIVEQFADAAALAISAGFDGVELHGANSYLLHQFLADNTNLRRDEYGGSTVNRLRLPLRVVQAVAARIGAGRTALRLSPGNPQFGMVESNPGPVYRALVAELDPMGLAYLHLTDNDDYPALVDLRPHWSGTLIANLGENREPTTRSVAEEALASGVVDAVSFGRGFLVNPDLPARLALEAPWNPIDTAHLYTPGPVGYVDYPALAAAAGMTTCASAG